MQWTQGDLLRLLFHELKTPVTAIKLQLSVLHQDPEVQHTAVLDRGLERIGRSASRLLHLVDLVLAWTHVVQGALELAPEDFDLVHLVEEVTGALDSQARARRVTLNLDVEPPASSTLPTRADRRLVRLVLINVLERAIAVSQDARIEISVQQTASWSRIHVRDGAPRRTATERAQAFAPQWAAQGRHRARDRSSGLGLLPARELAQALGGDLRWDDDSGPGNRLELEIPLEPRTSAPSDSPSSS